MSRAAERNWQYPGSGWWKFDFHTHTPASSDYGKGPNQAQLRQLSPEDWLLDYMRAGIDCVAVTDHNSSDWVDRLKQALADLRAQGHADFRELHLFPGVEVTANGGIHVLAIFDPSRAGSDVARLLGAVHYQGTSGESSMAAQASTIEVVSAVCGAGGLPILAHVDGPSGTFGGLSGNSLSPLLDCAELFAMEVCDTAVAKPDLYRQRKLAWAEVLGSDAHHPSGTGTKFPGSHFTWVKMERPCLDSLRLALLDGNGVSIRRSDDSTPFQPFATPEHFIESIEISEARFMGRGRPEILRFSPWFNAIIGGRGTGKSTIIHFLRLAYRRESELDGLEGNDLAAQTFKAFVRTPKNRDDGGGLQSEEKAVASVILIRDGVRYRLSWQQSGGSVSVEEEVGDQWTSSQSQEVTAERFPVRIFSQGQIASLASERSQSLLGLIDQAISDFSRLSSACDDEERRYLSLCANQRELVGRLKERDGIHVHLQDVRRKLARFEKEHHADVLKAYQRTTRQSGEIDRQFGLVDGVAKKLESAAAEIQIEDVPEGMFDADNATDVVILQAMRRVHEMLRNTVTSLKDGAQNLRNSIDVERQQLDATEWAIGLGAAKNKYADLVQALKSQGVDDPSEYGKLVQEGQRLEGELADLDALEKQRVSFAEQTAESLQALKTKRRNVSEARAQFLSATLSDNPYVRIEVEPFGRDVHALRVQLRDMVDIKGDDRFEDDILLMEGDEPKSGVVAEILVNLPTDAVPAVEQRLDVVKAQFADACRGEGKSQFGGHFTNYLKREHGKRPEFLDRIMAWFPEDTLQVRYSPRGDGRNFAPIAQGSAGQRAAAMLAFLLAYGGEPIVLDQPEDDLDNHLIYNLVVQQIRANKQKRQIVVVTHNANVVVNGDAEMCHAMDLRSGNCRVTERGSLQVKAMRDEVCTVMEGGREAFEMRYHRLGRG